MVSGDPKLGMLDGVVIFVAAASLWRVVGDIEEIYFFPNDPMKSLFASAVLGLSLLAWRGKNILAIMNA